MIDNKLWWKNIISKLVAKTESADEELNELKKTNPEIVDGLYQIKSVIEKKFVKKSYLENKVNSINDQILQYALNNYYYKIDLTDDDDLFDSLITSLNMLGDEINYSTISRQYLTDIFNTIPEFIIIVDKKGIIQTVNKNILDELGEANENLLNTSICSLFVEKLSLKDLENSADNNPILTLKRNANSNIPVIIKTSKFVESDHNESRTVFILSDLTEIIKYQKELENKNTEVVRINRNLKEALKKAEESDRLKSAFLANMSHEIRTPMNGILGFSSLLKEANLSKDEYQNYIDIIEKSGKRMLNIINDIVSISKIESGIMGVNFEKININSQLNYLYNFFKLEADTKGLELILGNTLLEKEANIITDGNKVYAVLLNLIKNAIKYTDKGIIRFGCDFIEIQNTTYLHFSVKDTGIGIKKEQQEKIFERFIQEDIEDVHVREGAGLGLTISKAYAEMLDGNLWVESKKGKGSEFHFTIPYKQVIDKDIKDDKKFKTKEDYPNLNLKVLVAEDDQISFNFISIVLKNYSKKIIRAKTGIEAVEKCRLYSDIDLILMDVKMPELNGYKATEQIRQFNKDVVIIAQTAFGLTGDKEKALNAGCNNYISKPIEIEKLLKLLHKYFK